jgi:hypothetical protein
LAASLAFKYYVVNISSYSATYGAIGGVMVLMLWFYISGVVILLGAEMNAEIEHASPYGKAPGEKVPGQRRIIGPAAMRAWVANRRRDGEKPPSAGEVKEAAEQKPGAKAAMEAAAKPSNDPGASMPARAPATTPSSSSASSGSRSRPSDWLLGTAFVMAQLWWAVKAFRTRTRG